MYVSPPPHHCILGLISTFKCDNLSALKTFMHGSPPPDQEKCQKIHQNRLTHSRVTPIQPLRQLYESPNIPLRKGRPIAGKYLKDESNQNQPCLPFLCP